MADQNYSHREKGTGSKVVAQSDEQDRNSPLLTQFLNVTVGIVVVILLWPLFGPVLQPVVNWGQAALASAFKSFIAP